MMTRRMRIKRQLRSARTAVLTVEERREALQAAERAAAQQDGRPLPETGAARDATPARRADVP